MIEFYKVKIKLEKRGMTYSEKVSMEKKLNQPLLQTFDGHYRSATALFVKIFWFFEALRAIGTSETEVNFFKKFQCFWKLGSWEF